MARPSTTGMPYLVRRPGSLIFSYWRNLSPSIAGKLQGALRCEWAGKSIDLDGKAVVRASLKTADNALARQRWAILHRQVEDKIAEALTRRTADYVETDAKRITLTPEQISAIAGQVRHDLLKEHDDAWVGGDRWQRMNVPGKRADMATRTFSALKDRSLDWMDFDVLVQEVRPNDDPRNPKLKYVTVREDLGEITRRLRGNEITDGLTRRSERELGLAILRERLAALHDIEERERGRSIVTPQRPDMPVTPTPKPIVTISGMYERWLKLDTRDPKTARDYELYFGYFKDKFGDLPVTDITRDIAVDYGLMLRKFPKSKPERMREAHPDAIIAWGDLHPEIKKLSRRTINNKALGPLAKMMKLARAHGFIGHNPCEDIKLKGEKDEAKEMLPFDALDLQRMIRSPVFVGQEERSDLKAGDEHFWIPLVGLFSGARMEEIGQLRITDINRDVDGISYLDVTILETDDDGDDIKRSKPSAPKKIKTKAGKRAIPVHSTLLALGFLDYVKEMRGKRQTMLFPNLRAYRGRYTKNLSRWWNRYQDKYMTDDECKVFHSFRHTFNRALREAFVEEEFRKILMGHAADSTNRNYGRGLSLGKLQMLLEKAIFPKVDFLAAKWR